MISEKEKKLKKNTIRLHEIFVFLILISLIKPPIVSNYENLNNIFYIWKFISLVIILILTFNDILKNKKIHIHNYLIGLLIFEFVWLLNDIYINDEYNDSLMLLINSISIILLIKHEYNVQPKETIVKTIANFCYTYCFAQIVSISYMIITKQNNDFVMYFLGYDNYSAFNLILMLTIIAYKDILLYKKINIFDLILIGIFFILYYSINSVTSLITLFIMLLAMLNYNKIKNIVPKITINKIIFFYLLFIIFIIMINKNVFIIKFIEYFGKDITFSGRTIIWKRCIIMIKQHLLLGYGTIPKNLLFDYIYYVLYGADHAHNLILELLLRTGIVGTIGYIIYLYGTLNKEKIAENEIILYMGLVLFFFLSLMDFYPNTMFLYITCEMIYNSKKEGNCEKK